ncbi:MAG: Ni/Fe hydrogenase subunit gamma [Verrucomicrobia bacterium]|nr:Ni/Fe hydrogenase subunit gamma [Verrucomicrobiota bacterium]
MRTDLDPRGAEATALDPMAVASYAVRRLKGETDDTFTLELQPVDGAARFSFAPGQFNMLYVFGVGEIPISISSDPLKPKTLWHTTREVGTVTRAMRQLKPGAVLGVRGPFGTHWPVDECEAKDVVIVAGGIGLAPLRPALYRILAQRDRYGRVVLLYGARTPADILYRSELERWRARFDLEVYATVDRAMSGWRGNVGVVTGLIGRAPFDALNTVALVCGPEVMMRFTVQELQRRGVRAQAIHLSMERNMKCAVGFCGHCQFGPWFVCKDGPVFRLDRLREWLGKWEV